MSVTWRILEGDCRDMLRSLPAGSVHTCVTSPPYFGLRDYGTGEWDGGDPECDHSPEQRGGRFATPVSAKQASNTGSGTASARDCPCGARRVDQQIGLEPTPDEFVAALVSVFREVRRVLRDDGTVWLNLGDSYSGAPKGNPGDWGTIGRPNVTKVESAGAYRKDNLPGVKSKDLIGIPWMVAFALRADGWYLRSDIIWSKPNPMPESVTDRPTKSHEYVFLLSKGPRYFYDADAIREADSGPTGGRQRAALNGDGRYADGFRRAPDRDDMGGRDGGLQTTVVTGRNKRSVWTVATQPYAGAHFATFPPKLIEPCILAGAPERCCSVCGAPWVRQTDGGESTYVERKALGYDQPQNMVVGGHPGNHRGLHPPGMTHDLDPQPRRTTGWAPACTHNAPTAPGVVLDPFAGAGTTGLVALKHNRSFIGIELNPVYAEMARWRIRDDAPLLNHHSEVAA